jgi:hypothetical protein
LMFIELIFEWLTNLQFAWLMIWLIVIAFDYMIIYSPIGYDAFSKNNFKPQSL